MVLCGSLVGRFSEGAERNPPRAKNANTSRRAGLSGNAERNRVATLRREGTRGASTARRDAAATTSDAGGKTGTQARRAAGENANPALNASLSSSVQTHRVTQGETLERIASRYVTTVPALVALNGLENGESVRAGQFLFVPGNGKSATSSASTASLQPKSVNAVWRRYVKAPKEKGVVNLSTPMTRFVGLVVDKDGRLRADAVRAMNGLLGAGGKHPPLPERLIRLIVRVSDTFGGQPIRVVSGYRTNSYYQDSRHRLSAAVDFAIAGVPNAVLCEYLRDFEDVGVGYYPNSSFVHLDVRNHTAYWVDYAGPGEPPRSTPNAIARARVSKRQLLAELKALIEREKSSLQQAASESSPDVPTLTVPELKSPSSSEDPDPARTIGTRRRPPSEPALGVPELAPPSADPEPARTTEEHAQVPPEPVPL